jgi:dihydroorotate dehydrogenase electron transfer subunit
MTDEKCRVLEHVDVGGGYRRLVLNAPNIVSNVEAGQFVHVRVPGLDESSLRRPFSVFNAQDDRLFLLYKEVGRGTRVLGLVKEGDEVMVLGPLGHGFPLECKGAALLVGGGYGVAPLYLLARSLLARNVGPVKLFAGGRSQADLLAIDAFRELGVEVFLATNDGSVGEKGLVTLPLDAEIVKLKGASQDFEIFACGPDPMLKAVAERALSANAKGWISMDRHMICGVGACYACIQKTVRGNSRCCIEGPVFAAGDLVWE